MSVLAVIPARFASTRFPGKPLVDLCGRSMLERVWLAAFGAKKIDHILVATEDERIVSECERIGAHSVLTSADLLSGTDRVAEAARLFGAADIVLNVQGDEPLLQPQLLDSLIVSLQKSSADVCTPVSRIKSSKELDNPTVCKVAMRSDHTAMYFSRSVIPYVRGASNDARFTHVEFWKHIGIYAYTKSALERFSELPAHPLELAESLEQLRLLADGASYLCVETTDELIAVDTPEDVKSVRAALGCNGVTSK